MEVRRSETCMSLPSISACGGRVVTWPSQEPARVFSLSKDFCASDGVAAASAAKAVAAIRTNTTESAMRDFMFSVLLFSFSAVAKIFWRTRFQQELSRSEEGLRANWRILG